MHKGSVSCKTYWLYIESRLKRSWTRSRILKKRRVCARFNISEGIPEAEKLQRYPMGEGKALSREKIKLEKNCFG